MYFRHACPKEVDRIYPELIAIKPGFHEIWVHDKYFDKSDYPEGQDVRSKVFRALRGYDDVHLRRYPAEINSKAYLTYASCNVTEGPFVFRKNLSVSYFSEIKKIRSKGQESKLTKKFHILGYHHGVRSRRLLKQLLKKADKFRSFM